MEAQQLHKISWVIMVLAGGTFAVLGWIRGDTNVVVSGIALIAVMTALYYFQWGRTEDG